MTTNIYNKVLARLDILDVKTSTPLLLAYSGGLDSHVLLNILASCDFKAQLTVIHINHGLMPDADKWSEHCRQVCLALDVPFVTEKVSVNKHHGQGLEAAAREARYQVLANHIQTGAVLLTAHHMDDQAETMLLQLMRGAGIPGLAAMPSVSEFSEGKLVRPLIGVSREELKNYAQTHKLEWIEDQSNQDDRFSRNFLRNNVLPILRKRWPDMNRQLARSASHQAEASELLKRLATQDLNACKLTESHGLNLNKLLQLDTLSLKNALRQYIADNNLLVPSEKQLRHIVNQIRRQSSSGLQQISWSGGELRIYRHTLTVSRVEPTLDSSEQLSWNGLWSKTGDVVEAVNSQLGLPGSGFILSASKAKGSGLSVKQLQKGPVTLRFRQGGESCLLPGRGHHHKLKKLFQEAGVPPWERSRLPLIYVGEELAAVADKWICAPFQAQAGEAGVNLKLNRAPE